MLRGIGLVALFMVVSLQAHAQTNKIKEWRDQVRIQLTSNASYPPAALGQLGTAKAGFVLDGHGRLVSHWLAESTGNRALDEESLAIIERSKTFPKPPPDLKELDRTFSIEFFFRRRPGDAGSWDEEQARLRTRVNSLCRGC